MRNPVKKKVVLGVVTSLLSFLILFLIFNFPQTQRTAQYVPFICLYPYSYNRMTPLNQTHFVQDINIMSNLGFKGVRLTNFECLYDEGLLEWAVDVIESYDLKLMLAFQFFDRSQSFPFPHETWSREGFPNNSTQMNLYCDYVANVTKMVRDRENLLWYTIRYPFDSSTEESKQSWIGKVQTIEYCNGVQRIIDSIRIHDTSHDVYLAVDLWSADSFPIYDELPYNFSGVSGYGFHYYTKRGTYNYVNYTLLDRLYDYFKDKGKVYVDEWGIQTNQTDLHGRATSEEDKAKMIEGFIHHFYNKDIVWCYFGLHDFPPEKADFGLIDENHNPRLGGLIMYELLNEDLIS